MSILINKPLYCSFIGSFMVLMELLPECGVPVPIKWDFNNFTLTRLSNMYIKINVWTWNFYQLIYSPHKGPY